jgi:hypothetical protein
VRDLAATLDDHDVKMTFGELLKWVQAHGFLTDAGTPYVNNRGVSRLVTATYWHTLGEHGEPAARIIARRFTDRNVNYAYDNY